MRVSFFNSTHEFVYERNGDSLYVDNESVSLDYETIAFFREGYIQIEEWKCSRLKTLEASYFTTRENQPERRLSS